MLQQNLILYVICRHINSKQASGSKINAIYSTPSCYLKAVNDQKIKFPTKTDDFFPYKSDKHSYWTGYFTSRPTQKYYERRGNNYLQVCINYCCRQGRVKCITAIIYMIILNGSIDICTNYLAFDIF